MRSADPLTRSLTAAGWIGLVLFLVWHELFAEVDRFGKWTTVWWFRVPFTLVLGLVVLVFALECLMQEMTVRRWATSVAVFTVVGVLVILAGVFNPDTLHLSRWVLLPLGAFYLLAAVVAGAGAKDVL
jgi:hypothetical protein